MRVISALKELSSFVFSINIEEKSIGFVPTMGALHKGHLSLIRRSIEENNVTIVSIFVNPLQFNDSKDLEKYPRTLREDLDLLRNLSVDIVFTPSEKDFYNTKPLVSINFGGMAQRLEGKFRKGHFEGVGVVVSKLLHLAMPSKAYFGLKDLQQYLLIKQMCQDLSFPCEIVGVETEREPSGLALSSRNRRLSTEGLEVASNIYKGLTIIEEGIRLEKSLESLLSKAKL
ncbi:MAG: pantoate--beta-alanine ligase, partial [Bacteroidota bacterium]